MWIGDHFNNPLAPSTFTHEASATIRGFSTGLFDPVGIALDGSGNIYVANDEGSLGSSFTPASVTVYPAGSSGNAAPSATISGDNTYLSEPTAIAIDSTGKIYVTEGFDAVVVFPKGSTGNATPSAIIDSNISGSVTDLDNPVAVAVDNLGNTYLANNGSQYGRSDTVSVYLPGSNSNVVPSATISGSNTGLGDPIGIAIDSVAGKIYVANFNNYSVTVYPVGTNGNASPSATISGFSTGLEPIGIALDSGGNIYVADIGVDSVFVFPAGS